MIELADVVGSLLMSVSSLLSPSPPPAPPPPASSPVLAEAVAVRDVATLEDAAPIEDAVALLVLECIGRVESNSNYLAVSESGRYRGKYQMDSDFFLRYGGDPDLAGRHEQASPELQDRVALNGYRDRGLDPWPSAEEVCG